ncbi:uncharacterized protein L203_105248 [Cryptococcus depauperatus CBS 7841]|uniref:Uncharacterized protein n=1 Tax=Cryptococcus depauperatus CBS 7841 TaxID=1295531 RepID=A0A1E3HYF1_9TREE|nr:hypothetical protein L203_05615 [Cryptococcus depauperatus CBS 7841]
MSSKRSYRVAVRLACQKRSFSITSNPRKPLTTWEPALPQGVSPAYDAALAYLTTYQNQKKSRLESLRSSLPETPSIGQLQQVDKLEVEAFANDPSIRRNFRETGGKGQMDMKVMRWLAEEKWRKEGELDLLMQRALQLNVVPDLLPDIPPTAPLIVSVGSSRVIPAAFTKPSALLQPPNITHQLFHHPALPTSSSPNPSALHTLLVVDADAPDHERHTFQERLHYLKTDIPLSVTDGEVDLTDSFVGKQVIAWEPPAPEQGTPYHRYVCLLFRQHSPLTPSVSSRDLFNTRNFLASQGLNIHDLSGLSLFRAIWSEAEDEFINKVFKENRGVTEGAPIYRRVPKEVKYGLPLNAKEKRKEEIREQTWERAVNKLEGITGEELVI